MYRQHRISRRAATLGTAGAVLGVNSTVARQGISPFQEATPADGATGQGWEIQHITPLELDGAPCALSPDGQWLAGVGPDRAFSIWRMADLQQTMVPFDGPIDLDSIAWAPDSTAVVFGLDAFRLGVDGDIYVYELADETVYNLNQDDHDDGWFSEEDRVTPFPIDVMPVWTPDSQSVVFARTILEEADSLPTDIVRMGRGGGDVETLLSVEARPFSIFTPMRVLADGTIVYTFAFSDVDDAMNGIWQLDPDGNTSQLVVSAGGEFPIPVLLDVAGVDSELRIAGISAALSGANDVTRPWLFTWSSDVGEPVPVADVDFTDPVRPFTAFWSPDGGTMLVVGRMLEGEGEITVETVGPASALTTLPESTGGSTRGPRWIRPTWSAANTVFIPAIGGSPYLLTMESAG